MAVEFEKVEKEIDFDELKSEWMSNFDGDETEGMESFEEMPNKVKSLTHKEIEEIENSIYYGVLERVEEEAYKSFNEKKLALYLENHPDENEDEYNEEAFSEFEKNLPRDTLEDLLLECYEELDDNVTDEMSRSETESTAEYYGIPVAILKHICNSAL